MLENIISWLENNAQPCLYKKMFGFECPGCGMQRSFIELLKGNFIDSLHLYPALLPTIFLFIITSLHLIFKFRNGALIIKYNFILIVILTIGPYIYKLLT